MKKIIKNITILIGEILLVGSFLGGLIISFFMLIITLVDPLFNKSIIPYFAPMFIELFMWIIYVFIGMLIIVLIGKVFESNKFTGLDDYSELTGK